MLLLIYLLILLFIAYKLYEYSCPKLNEIIYNNLWPLVENKFINIYLLNNDKETFKHMVDKLKVLTHIVKKQKDIKGNSKLCATITDEAKNLYYIMKNIKLDFTNDQLTIDKIKENIYIEIDGNILNNNIEDLISFEKIDFKNRLKTLKDKTDDKYLKSYLDFIEIYFLEFKQYGIDFYVELLSGQKILDYIEEKWINQNVNKKESTNV